MDQAQAAAEAELDGFIEAELRAIRAGRAANGGGASAGVWLARPARGSVLRQLRGQTG